MKIIPIALVALLVLSGLLVLVPAHASAASRSDVVTTNNVYGNQQNRFTVDGAMFFSVYLNVSSQQTVTLSVINTTSGSTLQSMNVATSSAGVYQSWVVSNFNFFDLSYYSPGSYKLQLSYRGSAVANASFTISYPVYTSYVRTTLSSYVKNNDYYLSGSKVYVSILTVDQFGNPMSGNTSASLYEMLYSGMANTSQDYLIHSYLVPNDYGIVDTAFYSGYVGYITGAYNITIEFGGYPAGSNNYSPVTGRGSFFLISPTLTISPYKPSDIYGQGTNLTFQGYFAPFSGSINVSIVSYNSGAVIYRQSNIQLSGGYWNGSYYVNYSVPDGMYYLNASEASNNYSLFSNTLYFQALELSAYSNQRYYLPGEPASIFYTVTNTSNNAPGTGVNVSYTMNYTTTNGRQSLGGIVSGGLLNLVIPSTAVIPSTVRVKLTAVDSFGHNATETLDLRVSSLLGSVETSQSTYFQAEPVIVSVFAMAGNSLSFTSPVAGASVYVNVSIGGSVVSSYSSSALTTNAQGNASYVFMLGRNVTVGTYTVSASIRAYDWSNTTTTRFTVAKQTPEYALQLVPGQSSYVGGQMFSMTWALINNGTAVTPAFASYAAAIGNSVVAAGTNSNGRISFQLPSGMSGTLFIEVSASDARGNSATSYAEASVSQAVLIVNPSTTEYSPSAVVTFSYQIVGAGYSSPVYFYKITDQAGNNVLSGTTTASSFRFNVPASPSDQYTVEITATNSTSGGVLTQSVTIYELSGLQFAFSISQSSYVTGTYSPGQTVKLFYRISTLGPSSPSSTYDIYVWISGFYDSYREYTVSAQSGTLSYQIPSGVGQGSYSISAYAVSLPGNSYTPTIGQSLRVSGVEPFWNYNVVGGVSLGSAIMGIVTLIALALAVIAYSGQRAHNEKGPRGGSGGQQPKARETQEQAPAEKKADEPSAGSQAGDGNQSS